MFTCCIDKAWGTQKRLSDFWLFDNVIKMKPVLKYVIIFVEIYLYLWNTFMVRISHKYYCHTELPVNLNTWSDSNKVVATYWGVLVYNAPLREIYGHFPTSIFDIFCAKYDSWWSNNSSVLMRVGNIFNQFKCYMIEHTTSIFLCIYFVPNMTFDGPIIH